MSIDVVFIVPSNMLLKLFWNKSLKQTLLFIYFWMSFFVGEGVDRKALTITRDKWEKKKKNRSLTLNRLHTCVSVSFNGIKIKSCYILSLDRLIPNSLFAQGRVLTN